MHLLDFLFPKRCLACGKIGKYFCNRCVGKIRFIEQRETICPVCERSAIHGATHPSCKTQYTIDGLTSFFHYDGVIQKAVKALKYRFISDLANEFVSLIPQSSFFLLPKSSTFVPIPLHSARLRHRGFNQAELLGRAIANKLQIPMRTEVLKRTRSTTAQVEMKDRDKRLTNMKNAFSLHSPLRLRSGQAFSIPHSMVLFDDVFTTGATMRAAANILKRAGVEFVWGITMAR
jgi:ComF family protein